MKVLVAFIVALTAVSAFSPQTATSRSSTALSGWMNDVFGLDLFEPVKDQNDYGARKKKNLKLGQVTPTSYVPDGLTLEQYKKVRAADQAKKDSSYSKALSKAFKYQSFNAFYQKRGTDLSGAWKKDEGLGHSFAKTKYDYSGKKNDAKIPEAFAVKTVAGKKK